MSHTYCPATNVSPVLRGRLLITFVALVLVAASSGGAQAGAGKAANPPEIAAPRFTPRWSAIAAAQPLPAGRHVHTLTYAAASDRAILFGGFAGGNPFGDVWALSMGENAAWTQIFPTGTAPTARRGHSAIYDSARDRIVVFGGFDGAYRNDTWQLSLGATPAWTALATTGGPPLSYWHSAIYDPTRDAMVIFGGNSSSGGVRNEVWILSFATMTWQQVSPPGSLPAPRFGHSAVYDVAADRMMIFGGHQEGGGFRNDSWALSLADGAWSEFVCGVVPTAREGAPAIYDPIEHRLIVFGGWDGSTTRNDTWALTLSSSQWSELPLSGLPPIRSGAASFYDPLRDRMVVFGGNSSAARNDTWVLRWLARPILADSKVLPRESVVAALPETFVLDAARPTPFALSTMIRFHLPSSAPVRLDVFDVTGRRVRTLALGVLPAGAHDATWAGDDDAGRAAAAGAYFLRIEIADGSRPHGRFA